MTERTTVHGLARSSARPRRKLVAAATCGIFAALAALATPTLAGIAVEDLVASDITSLARVLGVIVVLLGLRLVFDVGRQILAGRARYELAAGLRRDWFGRILAIPPGGEGDTPRQDWVSLLSYDVPRVAEVAVDLPLSVSQAILTLVGAVALMLSIEPLLTMLVMIAAPLAYFMVRVAIAHVRRRSRAYWDREVSLMSRADESFRGRWAVQAFSQEERVREAFASAVEETEVAGVAHLRLVALVGPITQFVTFCGVVGIVGLSSHLQLAMTPGELLSFVLYGMLLSQPLRAFADALSIWHEASATLDRFDAVQDAVRRSPVPGTDTSRPAPGRIEIEDLSFGWHRHEPLFDGASLCIEAREHVALRGANGAGKSTLIALLLGFVEPQGGSLRVADVELRSLDARARRGLFAVVPQHAALVGATVREAVTFARPDATDAELQAALDAALATPVVDRLPDGLDTPIGEDGARLSGGERQRLAVARALLADAPILVFDEPTASYDADATVHFVANVAALLCDKTVLWITHEDAPLAGVSRVVHLESGQFVEEAGLAIGVAS